MSRLVPPLKEVIRIALAYKPGTPAWDHLYAYGEEVNEVLGLMGAPEATFYDVVRMYEDECSVDQAAYEIADPMFGYDAYLEAKAEAWATAHSEAR